MSAGYQGWTPRRAVALLTLALRHVDAVVQPPEIRDPVTDILRAAVESCATKVSLLGLSIEHALSLAQGIVTAAGDGGDHAGG